MKTKIILISLLGLLLLLPNCSNKATNSPAIDDTIPPATFSTSIITIDSVKFTFKLLPIASGESLWVSTTEITQKQYAKIMDSIAPIDDYPVSVNWFNAALFANKITHRVNSDSGLSLDTVYEIKDSIRTFTPPRVRTSGFICLTSDSLKNYSDTFAYQGSFDSVMIFNNQVCSLTISSQDTIPARKSAIFNNVVSLNPDSISINNAGVLSSIKLSPHKLGIDKVLFVLDSSAKIGSEIKAFKHSFRMRNNTIYNSPLAPGFSDPAINTVTLKLDSTSTSGHLVYFFSTPPESLLKVSFTWAYAYPSPDAIKDYPHVYTSRTWETKTSKAGFRLPTASEWECIARCGQIIDYSTYNGKLSSLGAVYGKPEKAVVGSIKPNPWGIYDITGNLAEWTSDWWNNFGEYIVEGIPKTDQIPLIIVKGGSFKNSEADSFLRISVDYSALPDSTSRGSIGFRLVAKKGTHWQRFIKP